MDTDSTIRWPHLLGVTPLLYIIIQSRIFLFLATMNSEVISFGLQCMVFLSHSCELYEMALFFLVFIAIDRVLYGIIFYQFFLIHLASTINMNHAHFFLVSTVIQ